MDILANRGGRAGGQSRGRALFRGRGFHSVFNYTGIGTNDTLQDDKQMHFIIADDNNSERSNICESDNEKDATCTSETRIRNTRGNRRGLFRSHWRGHAPRSVGDHYLQFDHDDIETIENVSVSDSDGSCSTDSSNSPDECTSKDPDQCMEIVNDIIENYENITDHLKYLSIILNSNLLFHENQVYSLLRSFNTFKANTNDMKTKQHLFNEIIDSSFVVDTLEPIINQFFQRIIPKENMETIIAFFINILELLDEVTSEKVAKLIPYIEYAALQFSDNSVVELTKAIRASFKSAKEKASTKTLLQANTRPSIDKSDFKNCSVIPVSSDIFCLNEEVQLRPNKFIGENLTGDFKYESVDDYLDTHFRLLKEDFVRPLRDGIAAIRLNMLTESQIAMDSLQVRFYDGVIIDDLFPSKSGLLYRVMFDVSKLRNVDWTKTKRFIFGSLLCFTNNFFGDIYFASVVENDPKHLSKGILFVQFDEDPISKILENNTFMMLETKHLFEAYRHVLSKLQSFKSKTFPFKSSIVYGRNTRKTPVFMTDDDLIKIHQSASENKELDESQNKAFVNSLNSRLSMIQGPPGTGKTYVGLKILKYLVNTFQTADRNIGPILVVCYTNHALDQFLLDIIQSIGIENVIRVGGRSKVAIMKDCNITTLRWKWIRKKSLSYDLFMRAITSRSDMELAEHKLVNKYNKVMHYDKKLLSFRELQSFMSRNHAQYFEKIDFNSWIRGGDTMLKNDSVDSSAEKRTVINHHLEVCVSSVVNDMLLEVVSSIFEESAAELDNNEDVTVEVPEDFLNNQRYIDEGMDITNVVNKFKNFYDEDNDNDNFLTDDEGFHYVANLKFIKHKLHKMKLITQEDYGRIKDLDVDLGLDVRLQLYKYWSDNYRFNLLQEYGSEKTNYDKYQREKDDILFEEYHEIMKSAKVIGMTTTGAARFGSVLDKVGCRVVVIEEAAEVLESHVVCSLSGLCEQLIMIGDHKQLRPTVEVYALERDYNLGISLFERLIANKCEYVTLQYQHRMRPEISACVKPIYPGLQDSENVFHYSSVHGMKSNVYFFNHKFPENQNAESSYSNDFEAKFVVRFCEYLISSGNLPRTITVLTMYTGQLLNISKWMTNSTTKGVRVLVVDNFQGEENEIIILSMVRSNDSDVVGFVNSPNRLCVALSRAKRGLYVIGNFAMLNRKIKFLKDLFENHINKKDIGNKLPLKCIMHPNENNYFVQNYDDFSKSCCPSTCGMVLACGHSCTRKCHMTRPCHASYKCMVECDGRCQRNIHEIKLPCFQYNNNVMPCVKRCHVKLVCGHKCSKLCHEVCKCESKVINNGDCGHPIEYTCGDDLSLIKCQKDCSVTFGCGHKINYQCFEQIKSCTYSVDQSFSCGHSNAIKCGLFDLTDNYSQPCAVSLYCGHTYTGTCGQCYRARTRIVCQKRCNKYLKCGHYCDQICHRRFCPPCTQPCSLSCKHHTCSMQCAKTCGFVYCGVACEKDITCSTCNEPMQCPKLCSETCNETCLKCYGKAYEIVKHVYVNLPCKCNILKKDFHPQTGVVGNDLILSCQVCGQPLQSPYVNETLRFYNKQYLTYFKPFPSEIIHQWSIILDDLRKFPFIPTIDLDVIHNRFRTGLMFKDDDRIFETSFDTYIELTDICQQLYQLQEHKELDKHKKKIEFASCLFIKWLNPFIRLFNEEEIADMKLDTSKLHLSLDIITYLQSVELVSYDRIKEQWIVLLELIKDAVCLEELGTFYKTINDFKRQSTVVL